ncbi:MAG: signal peptidase II, partial [Bifidobacteriaceae bacterium]|nr:signal peptidase II [Bifidobacteriaceae bacterium]
MSTRPPARRGHAPALLVAVAVLAVAADQVSKVWARHHLSGGRTVEVVGNFLRLQLIGNPGAAFSVGEGKTIVFTLLAALFVILIAVIAPRVTSRVWALALGLIWGGAAGNLIDRLIRPPALARGRVTDFIAY